MQRNIMRTLMQGSPRYFNLTSSCTSVSVGVRRQPEILSDPDKLIFSLLAIFKTNGEKNFSDLNSVLFLSLISSGLVISFFDASLVIDLIKINF